MIEIVVEIVQWAFILAGSFFLVAGAFGIMRMPDLFTRIHAASVCDTLGASFLIFGMAIESGFSLVTFKLAVILALFFFTTPLATHALARAALVVGVKPLLAGDDGTLRAQAVEAAPLTDALWEREELEGARTGAGSAEQKAAAREALDRQDIASGDAGALATREQEEKGR